MQSDVRIVDVRTTFRKIKRRGAFRFGKGTLTENLVCDASVEIENRSGHRATGRGSINLAAAWAFPSEAVSMADRLRAMNELSAAYGRALSGGPEWSHPINTYWGFRDEMGRIASSVSECAGLAEPIPTLAAYVCYAPIDMALLDAYGRANGVCTYRALGPEFMGSDLSAYLGAPFIGKYVGDYVRPEPAAHVAISHTVGGNDKLTRAELSDEDPQDGLPVALEDWIRQDGMRNFKIKLTGRDVAEDVERTREVFQVASLTLREHCGRTPCITIDHNEQYDSPEAVIEYLARLREHSEAAFDALLYVEQPVPRDFGTRGANMREAAALKPTVVDESITDTESVRQAIELGWTGLGIKAGKVLSSALLCIPLCVENGLFLTVQDLCNSGLAHLASLGLAARLDLVGGVESNGRQFVPHASQNEALSHPDLFTVQEGKYRTAGLTGVGLGFSPR